MKTIITILFLCSVAGSQVKTVQQSSKPPRCYVYSEHAMTQCIEDKDDAARMLAAEKASAGHDIDWKDCQQVTKQWEAQVQGFNAKHAALGDGLQIQLGCLYSNPAPKKPTRKIALTLLEAARLSELRRASGKVSSTESSYEEELLKAHGVARLGYADPCWYFVGIIFDEYSITIDPNTSMPVCTEN